MGKPAGETREGKMVIIREKVATERRLEDLKKKDFGERERAEKAKEGYSLLLFSCKLHTSREAVYVFLISLFSPLFS